MDKQIFPASILEQSADQLFNERLHLSGILYLTVIAVVVVALIAINFIKVDVNVHASGILKPKEDHAVITATTSGYIKSYHISPNAYVKEGDTLFVIQSDILTSKLPALNNRKSELEAMIHDLRLLTHGDPFTANLKSAMYKQDVLYYITQWNEANAKKIQAESAYKRNKKLYDANVIPLSEFEPIELNYKQAENALTTLADHQKRQWQSDLLGYQTELNDILVQLRQIQIQSAETAILSPVNGTVQQIQTLFDGSFITAGQQIVEISPDGELIAECYVEPKDIGYLRPGMSGKIQISAYNYTEWGMLDAVIEDVFEDVSVSSDGTHSYYKVYCSLAADHLTLKNGFEGYIKKGMIVNANFIITSRTVFQLLYDKIDNWLNPNIVKDYESGD